MSAITRTGPGGRDVEAGDLGILITERDELLQELQRTRAESEARSVAILAASAQMLETANALERETAGIYAQQQLANRVQREKNEVQQKVIATVIGILLIGVIAAGVTYGVVKFT